MGLTSNPLLAAGLLLPMVALFLRPRAGDLDESEDFEGDEEGSNSHSWLGAAGRCLLFTLAGVLMLIVNIVINQRNLLYKPVVSGKPRISAGKLANPRYWGLQHQSYFISSMDGTELHSWLLHTDAPKGHAERKATILFFHSNAGDVAQRLDFFKRLCTNLDVAVLALEYRGYGRSGDGKGISEAAFVEDAYAAYDWLLKYASLESSIVDPNRIFLFGRSLGGCVAVRLLAYLLGASPQRAAPGACGKVSPLTLPAGIVLENVPSSIAEVARHILPPLRLLPQSLLARPLLRDEWRSSEWLAWIGEKLGACPLASRPRVCLLSGLQDKVVPPFCMDQLRRAAEAPKTTTFAGVSFHRFPRGEHMNTYIAGGSAYWDALQKFISL